MRRTLVLLLLAAPLGAQSTKPLAVPRPPAAMSAIREADLKRDLYAMAGDDMRGREAGTLDEMRASVWSADEMAKAGLKPFGEGGTWYQWWNMRRTRISSTSSTIKLGTRPLAIWTDITPTSNAAAEVMAATIFVGDGSDSTVDVKGRVAVVVMSAPPAAQIRSTTNTPEYNYTRPAITAVASRLTRRGAAAVVIIADSIGEIAFDGVAKTQMRGAYDVVGGVPRFTRNPNAAGGAGRGGRAGGTGGAPPAQVPVLLVHRNALTDWRPDAQMVDIRLHAETFETPSVNVIGVVRGTDPKLRNQYVLFSSHQDHDGVRYTVAGDSIWNGADDNGSTSVALLAIARAWVKQPSKRSALFIFHGAEERGLLGSRYHAAHPVVPLDSIIAVINGDMIGRNNPDTAALLGSQPPHRNSTALVQMAIDANTVTGKFIIDSTWDRPTHPEGWYFRSDHVPYAERNVPSLFFSTNLHNDYHTPRDEPKNIDYPKLTRMTQWMYMTGWLAANAPTRPALDPGFVLR
ncbi:MAG: peptidase family protein [Gemmatimonadetes bacterium]|nr:peptidase family protein [Gemmatimonadota bacterium]